MSWKARQKRRMKKRAKQARPNRPDDAHLSNSVMLVESPPGQKMSEVILELIDPYREVDEDKNLAKLVTVGIIAWNMSLMGEQGQSDTLKLFLQGTPVAAHAGVRQLFAELIRRKELLFPDNDRAIVDFQLTMDAAGPYLLVASTLDSETPRWLRPVTAVLMFFAALFGWILSGVKRLIPSRT